MDTVSTDRIEKRVVLRAPRSRVWEALTQPDQFGQWFGVKLTGPFRPGAHITGQVTHKGYEHIPFKFTIDRMEPEHLFSWRWHVLLDPESGLVAEPATLVVFELEDIEEGTLLRVSESGFDAIPPQYREAAFRGNEGGWAQQMESITQFLAKAA